MTTLALTLLLLAPQRPPVPPPPPPTPQATKAQIKAAVQSFVAQQLGTIIPVQNRLLNTGRGIPFQGIRTPNVPPDDGASVVADYTKRPTDQVATWADTFRGADALPASVLCQWQIDVYEGPLGKGWSLTARATKAGTVLQKTWAFGPEAPERATDWIEYPVNPPVP